MGTTNNTSNPVAYLRSNYVPLEDQLTLTIRGVLGLQRVGTESRLTLKPIPWIHQWHGLTRRGKPYIF